MDVYNGLGPVVRHRARGPINLSNGELKPVCLEYYLMRLELATSATSIIKPYKTIGKKKLCGLPSRSLAAIQDGSRGPQLSQHSCRALQPPFLTGVLVGASVRAYQMLLEGKVANLQEGQTCTDAHKCLALTRLRRPASPNGRRSFTPDTPETSYRLDYFPPFQA